MKYKFFKILIVGIAFILFGCRWSTPYRVDAYGEEIPVNFVGNDCLHFPPEEAEEAIDWLRYKVTLGKNEKLYNIKVYKDHIKINTIIETKTERKKRLAGFLKNSPKIKPSTKGRVIIMKTKDGYWFLSEVKGK